jgi:y4mF family transcriptional regulator
MTKSKNENAISKIIKTKRKELDLTQQEFALRVGVGLRLIREIEQGKLNLNLGKLMLILDFLGIELRPIDRQQEWQPARSPEMQSGKQPENLLASQKDNRTKKKSST